jgi:hypothetical protein
VKLNIVEWSMIVAALKIAAKRAHDKRSESGISSMESRELYKEAMQFSALAEKVESEKVS